VPSSGKDWGGGGTRVFGENMAKKGKTPKRRGRIGKRAPLQKHEQNKKPQGGEDGDREEGKKRCSHRPVRGQRATCFRKKKLESCRSCIRWAASEIMGGGPSANFAGVSSVI